MRRALLLNSVVAVALAATNVHAQSAPAAADATTPGSARSSQSPPADAGHVEEVIVTAQRRSESLQKVPIAVTAVTAASLARNAVTDITDLAAVVPGLHISDEIGFVTSQLRGVGTNNLAVGFENPVAIYVDGVYYASPSASVVEFNNIERVEVLKGPQGTLFGRNATGGLINIVTKDPSSTPGGSMNFSYGNYDTIHADAYFTTGLTDHLSMDFAVHGTHQGEGWGTNVYDGRDNYQVDHDIGAAAKILYKNQDTRITFSADFSDFRNSLNSQVLYPGTVSAFTGQVETVPGRYDTNTNVPGEAVGRNGGASLQIEQDIGFARLKSISAVREATLTDEVDVDETPVPATAFLINQLDQQISQEIQILSKGSSRFTWVVGGYYFNALDQWDPFGFMLGTPAGAPVPLAINSFDKIRTESVSGYAQGTYALTRDTKLTLGGRITHETKSREAYETTEAAVDSVLMAGPGVNIPVAQGTPFGPVQIFPKATISYDPFTFRVALDHQFTSDTLGYLSFNRGFKSGGYNAAVYSSTVLSTGGNSYQPEQLDAYEAGVKTTLFDHRLRVNAAGFYYNYSNIQLPYIIETTTVTINAAQARIYGVDGDFEARLTEALRMTGGFQFIDDRYLSFPSAPLDTKLGGVPLTTGSAKGNSLNFVPNTTINVGFDYTIANVAKGQVNLATEIAYNGGYYLAPDNIQRQSAFALINATVKWTGPNGVTVGVFGKNLGDVRQVASYQNNYNGDQPTEWAAPRTYGVNLGYKF